ncbi:sodium channel protein Nach-like [Anopheles ziemanni]|uniref:sodium channel protein Nach-like n=1 Tax=Anopheles coustani TaxID=139045 RepID=UPI002659BAD6|nr:sodium channel protein Nach-like [Anopheles coustani]XP_058175715.1 sodium channel protein Nach-like [Anopheles ziemanni]
MYGSVWNLLSIYLYNPLTFYVDTSYLHWNTTFPAISVCQVENSETIAEVSEEYFGADRDPLVDSLITDIAFYGGTCYSCEECLPGGSQSSTVDCAVLRNFSEIVLRHRAACDQLLTGCQWQRESFDCCKLFRPLDTEFGRCYSVNTANARPKFVSNRATGPGQLRFRVLEDVQLYLHDEFSVPHAFVDRALRETVLWGMRKEIAVRVIETENKDTVQELPIWRRSCRFPWEVVGGAHQLYRHYSFSTCSLECFRRTQLEYCNCTHHLMPLAINPPAAGEVNTPVCSFEGLACLTEHSVEIAQARKQCPCLSSCVEPEYFVVYKSEDFYPELEEEEGHVTVQLLSLPHERFVRNIAKTEMDLFIALGGLIGLFYGMSLLTTIDFLINLCSLTFGSIYRRQWPTLVLAMALGALTATLR